MPVMVMMTVDNDRVGLRRSIIRHNESLTRLTRQVKEQFFASQPLSGFLPHHNSRKLKAFRPLL